MIQYRIWLDSDTNQLILSNNFLPHNDYYFSPDQKSIDLHLIRGVNKLDFIIHDLKVLDKWYKDNEMKKLDDRAILIIDWGENFVFTKWLLLCLYFNYGIGKYNCAYFGFWVYFSLVVLEKNNRRLYCALYEQ